MKRRFDKIVAKNRIQKGQMIKAFRYDERDLPNGYVFTESEIFVDGEATGQFLEGTCAIFKAFGEEADNEHLYLGCKYEVSGEFVEFGNDDGEIVLSDCKILRRCAK